MRAAAEVREVALRVERDVSFGRVDELDLVLLTLVREELLRLLGRDLFTRPLAALVELPLDLGLDLLERLLADRLRELEVVVEPVLDRRPDGDLRPRIEPANGLGEEVGCRMAEDVQRVRIGRVARGQDLDRLAVLERQPEILHAPVRAHENGFLGQFGADRGSRIEARRAIWKFQFRRVGKKNAHGTRGY